MRALNVKRLWMGIVFVAIGAAFFAIARNYPMGTAGRMGPGYFPAMLAVLLMVVGALVSLQSVLTAPEPMERLDIARLLLICGSVVVFGLLVRTAGIALAAMALVLVSALASRAFDLRWAIPLAVALAAVCALVFVRLLGLPVPVLPPFAY